MACRNSACSCCGHEHNHEEENRTLVVIRLISGAILFLAALFFKINYLFLISYIILGYDVVINAIKNVRHIFNESFLMTIATFSAFALGEFAEACCVMLFYQIGEFLSDYAQDKAKDSIGSLMDLRSDTANLLTDAHFETVPSEQVNVGDIIRVSAGEKVPLDGVITNGSAYFDTKALTGESVPRLFTKGDEVLSGYVSCDSVIEIKTTKKYDDSTASKILALLSDEKKARSEKFITRFSRIYTPIVVLFAVLIAVLPLFFGGEYKVWLYRAILFLVVSCPCALVVSVPLSFFAGVGCASSKGILVKGAYILEKAAKIKNFAFDKTGTLTDGKFCVRSIDSIVLDGKELLKYCAYCEFYSIHPIANAIKEFYGKRIDESLISDYREFSGMGVSANVDSHKVEVGSADFLKLQKDERGSVYVSIDGVFAGSIKVSDMTKAESKSAVLLLKNLGISSFILTGDTFENAHDVSDELNIPFYASLLPQDKISKINELKKSGITAFAGDGINDAPVLSIADVGVSMGKIGSDAAIESSDVVLTSDNLEKLPVLVKIARKTMRIVYENVILSISVKMAVMLLGALGIATIWLAVFADVGVLILAVINSLRAFLVRD
ncbi:MAG: cadmium-translocating P-type ATPase [Firmicutes bacterium]|nr:cadmium-translocating P-type ATPase [Bacillota bacterium]